MANTPIANGNKLVKNRVPENQLGTGGLTNFFVALGFLGLIGDFNSGLIFDLIFGLAFIGLSELTG
jgi:hypothetical protein